MRTLSLPVLGLLSSALTAQQFTETFPYPDGPAPGWTNQTLTMSVKNQRLVPTGVKSAHYITLDAYPNVAASVVDVDVFYPTPVNLHYGGAVSRHPGGTGAVGQIYAKLQDNSAAGYGYYSAMWLYEASGSATNQLTGINTLASTVRLITRGRVAWFQLDANLDGVFESTITRPFAAVASKDRGFVGITGYNLSEMDNFKFYDAVLQEDPTTLPKIGTVYKMSFTAELVNAAPTPWIVALSLGKAGIPVLAGRQIPLTADALFNVSVGFGMTGLLTASSPDGTASIALPNNAALVGLQVFAAGVTIDGNKPLVIGAISNDHGFVITN